MAKLAKIKYGKGLGDAASESGDIPVYGTGGLMGYAKRALYNKPSVLIGRKGTIEKARYVEHPFWTVDTLFYTEINTDIVLPRYFFYILRQVDFRRYDEGTTIPSLRTETLNRLKFDVPSIEAQRKVVFVVSSLENKIELNDRINANLEEQAKAIFRKKFPQIRKGAGKIGDYVKPKRGKGLLSKDAVYGNIPVVAGGLGPATYHNTANTVPPVVTISGSGANAGFVSLWSIPVWSSDSSFIDSKMTDDVYFWYVLLKTRQKEIYYSQTGSAQPHVYPKTISELPLSDKITKGEISAFTECVTPMFEKIGQNKSENIHLSSLRDALIPRLVSGELDVSDLDFS